MNTDVTKMANGSSVPKQDNKVKAYLPPVITKVSALLSSEALDWSPRSSLGRGEDSFSWTAELQRRVSKFQAVALAQPGP